MQPSSVAVRIQGRSHCASSLKITWLQPIVQRKIRSCAAQKRHRRMRMKVHKPGHADTAGSVDRLIRRKCRRRFAFACVCNQMTVYLHLGVWDEWNMGFPVYAGNQCTACDTGTHALASPM